MALTPPTAPEARSDRLLAHPAPKPIPIAPPPLAEPSRNAVLFALLGFMAAAIVALIIGGLAPSGSANPWYAAANKPPITPPGWVFPLVWVPLYLIMGYSAFHLWAEVKGHTLVAFPAFSLWALQLVLNVAWSWVFFGLRAPWPALAVILALWVTLVVMIAAFWRVSAAAGAMNAPYLAWVSFATVLNFWFALIN